MIKHLPIWALISATLPALAGDYAPLAEITPHNVDGLLPAWTYSSGDIGKRGEQVMRRSKFQATPILAGPPANEDRAECA